MSVIGATVIWFRAGVFAISFLALFATLMVQIEKPIMIAWIIPIMMTSHGSDFCYRNIRLSCNIQGCTSSKYVSNWFFFNLRGNLGAKKMIDIHCFVHTIFCFWSLLATKSQKYYIIFVYILQGKTGKTKKNWKKITQLKWPKNQNAKKWDEQNIWIDL